MARTMHYPTPEECRDLGFEVIGRGMSSTVLRAPGGDVLKYGKRTTAQRALKQAERSSHNVRMVQGFLGEFAVPTVVGISDDTCGGHHVVHRQPFIEGKPLKSSACDVDQLMQLYDRALRMYDATGYSPDIACAEHGWFNPLLSPNLLVSIEGNLRVVDTDFGRIQQLPGSSLFWNWLISEGIVRAKFDLSERRATFSPALGYQAT